jgi:hypothetical protein
MLGPPKHPRPNDWSVPPVRSLGDREDRPGRVGQKRGPASGGIGHRANNFPPKLPDQRDSGVDVGHPEVDRQESTVPSGRGTITATTSRETGCSGSPPT